MAVRITSPTTRKYLTTNVQVLRKVKPVELANVLGRAINNDLKGIREEFLHANSRSVGEIAKMQEEFSLSEKRAENTKLGKVMYRFNSHFIDVYASFQKIQGWIESIWDQRIKYTDLTENRKRDFQKDLVQFIKLWLDFFIGTGKESYEAYVKKDGYKDALAIIEQVRRKQKHGGKKWGGSSISFSDAMKMIRRELSEKESGPEAAEYKIMLDRLRASVNQRKKLPVDAPAKLMRNIHTVGMLSGRVSDIEKRIKIWDRNKLDFTIPYTAETGYLGYVVFHNQLVLAIRKDIYENNVDTGKQGVPEDEMKAVNAGLRLAGSLTHSLLPVAWHTTWLPSTKPAYVGYWLVNKRVQPKIGTFNEWTLTPWK